MFEGDVEAGKMHMLPMHALLCGKVVLSPDRRRLDSLPPPSRLALLSVVAMYLPYYAPQVHPPPPLSSLIANLCLRTISGATLCW